MVRELLRLMKCEFSKFKRIKLFSFAMMAAFVFPVFNSVLLADADFVDIQVGVL